MGTTLMEALEKAGYPREQMFNHNSDLYVFVTPVTTRVINDWCAAEGISKEVFLETFKGNITGRPMYSIAFQYMPYWEERANHERPEFG